MILSGYWGEAQLLSDWCCSDYISRNSLVALLEALCALDNVPASVAHPGLHWQKQRYRHRALSNDKQTLDLTVGGGRQCRLSCSLAYGAGGEGRVFPCPEHSSLTNVLRNVVSYGNNVNDFAYCIADFGYKVVQNYNQLSDLLKTNNEINMYSTEIWEKCHKKTICNTILITIQYKEKSADQCQPGYSSLHYPWGF